MYEFICACDVIANYYLYEYIYVSSLWGVYYVSLTEMMCPDMCVSV